MTMKKSGADEGVCVCVSGPMRPGQKQKVLIAHTEPEERNIFQRFKKLLAK